MPNPLDEALNKIELLTELGNKLIKDRNEIQSLTDKYLDCKWWQIGKKLKIANEIAMTRYTRNNLLTNALGVNAYTFLHQNRDEFTRIMGSNFTSGWLRTLK